MGSAVMTPKETPLFQPSNAKEDQSSPSGVAEYERTDGVVHVLGTGRQRSPLGSEVPCCIETCIDRLLCVCQGTAKLNQALGFHPHSSVCMCIPVLCKITLAFEWCYFARLLSPQSRGTNSRQGTHA